LTEAAGLATMREKGITCWAKKTPEGPRPKIRSSHGAPRVAPGPGARTKVPRPRRADPVGPRTRKARPAPFAPREARDTSTSLASDDARELAIAIAVAALDKKALGLEILDVAGKVDYADFLVLMTGRSDRQVLALAQGIEDTLRKKGKRPLSVEGLPHGNWVLMDFGDVVVHVFQDDARSLYDIEGLWMDARRIPVPMPESMRET
jgi:ribosome-associated protein